MGICSETFLIAGSGGGGASPSYLPEWADLQHMTDHEGASRMSIAFGSSACDRLTLFPPSHQFYDTPFPLTSIYARSKCFEVLDARLRVPRPLGSDGSRASSHTQTDMDCDQKKLSLVSRGLYDR